MQEIEWNKLPERSLNLKIYISIKLDHKIQRFIGNDEDLFKTVNVCVLLPCRILLFCHSLSLFFPPLPCPYIRNVKIHARVIALETFNFQCIHKSQKRKGGLFMLTEGQTILCTGLHQLFVYATLQKRRQQVFACV